MNDFSVKIKIQLFSHVVNTLPEIVLGCNNQQIENITLSPGAHNLEYNFKLDNGKSKFYIDFKNKQYSEWSENSDMAVEIVNVQFQNLPDNFNHLSFYVPDYPTEEEKQKWDSVIHSNYMGWNGRWYLEFETPIYYWLHQKLDLGWLI